MHEVLATILYTLQQEASSSSSSLLPPTLLYITNPDYLGTCRETNPPPTHPPTHP